MLDKKHLEIILSKLKGPERPKEELEQYTTPSEIVADILNDALLAGDIEDRTVAEFGCGSGRFAIGAALLGAKKVVAVDIDKEMIELAKENAEASGVSDIIDFVSSDVSEFSGRCDTVLQNPPFGMRGEEHADRPFLKKALECGRKVYSLHRGSYEEDKGSSKTQKFLMKFIKNNGGRVLNVKRFKFYVPYMFKFHKRPKVSYNVDLFVIERLEK